MKQSLFSSANSLAGRLGLFFSFVSIVIGLFCYALTTWAVLWSEDRVNERKVQLDMQEAIGYFSENPQEPSIRLDVLTEAYKDMNLIPKSIAKALEGKDSYLEEIDTDDEHDSTLIYLNHAFIKGEKKPIIIISHIDPIEIGNNEFALILTLTLLVILGLISVFGVVQYRLSQRLIAPVISLKHQLDSHKGNPKQKFEVSDDAASEFRNLATHLNQYREEINFLIKREQAFARYASHELRTPLTVMKGASGLLARSEQTDFQKRQLTRIQDSTKSMSTMVDALLALVRYERNHADVESRKITQAEIERSLKEHQSQADDKSINFVLTVKSEPEMAATEAVVSMLFGNLLRNAIAATSEGQVEIYMDEHQLSVKDSGAGLSETPSEDGHGLGLMIVDDLCNRYGWRFTLRNNEGEEGCTATILFNDL